MRTPTLQMAGGWVDITPSTPVPLFGFGGRTAVYERIADRLEANAVLVDDGSQSCVIVAVDVLYIGELRERVEARLGGMLSPSQLFMGASHTHFAPATDSSLPALGALDEGYLEEASDAIARMIRGLLEGARSPAVLEYREAPLPGAVNRRRSALRLRLRPKPSARFDVLRRVNDSGPVDRQARVAMFCGAGGATRALLWNWACHPSSFPNRGAVSAEFPGHVRRALRVRFGEELPVVFLQGFAGNVRARMVQAAGGLRARIGQRLEGHRFAHPTYAQWQAWADRLAETVVTIASQPGQRCEGAIDTRRVDSGTSLAVDARVAPLCAHRVSFGSRLHLVGLSAEAMAEHGPCLRAALPDGWIVPVGYIDRTQLYLATDEMRHAGGYEGGGFVSSFGLSGELANGADATVRRLLRHVARGACD